MAARKKTAKTAGAKKKAAVKKSKPAAKKAAKKPAAAKAASKTAAKAAPKKKAVAGKAPPAAKKTPPTKPTAAPAPTPVAPAKPPIAAKPAVVPAKPVPTGSISAQDVNLGHIAALKPRTHTGFKLEAFQAARRALEQERWATIEDAARAVAAKAVEISNESGGRNGFGSH
jgi:hypothetical protein